MKAGSVIGTATAIARTPFARVLPLVSSSGAASLLDVVGREEGLTIGAEPDQGLVWMHGGYWYQGEYLFARHPDGTEVTYRIRNISGHPDAVIRLWQRKILKRQQHDLEEYVTRLPQRL